MRLAVVKGQNRSYQRVKCTFGVASKHHKMMWVDVTDSDFLQVNLFTNLESPLLVKRAKTKLLIALFVRMTTLMKLSDRHCSKCKKLKPVGSFYKDKSKPTGFRPSCKECDKPYAKAYRNSNKERYAASHKTWRKKNRKQRRPKLSAELIRIRTAKSTDIWRKKNVLKTRVHKKVAVALKSGWLLKMLCHICDSPNSHAHHEDYSKPLEVHWLCPKHHKERHVELKAEKCG